MSLPDIYEESRRYKRFFPKGCDNRNTIEHVWLTTNLYKKGDATENVEAKIKASVAGQQTFIWRVPYDKEGHMAHGIVAKVNGITETPKVTNETAGGEGVIIIELNLGKMTKSAEVTVQIEYIAKGVSRKRKAGFLLTEWECNWVYQVVHRTRKLTIKVCLPESSRFSKKAIRFSLGEFGQSSSLRSPNIVFDVENPTGTIIGNIKYHCWSPALPFTLPLAVGLLLALPLQLLTSMTVTTFLIPLIVVFMLLAILVFHYVMTLIQ